MVSFNCSRTEARLLSKIAKRAVEKATELNMPIEFSDMEMDLTACHCNGNPLDLEKLLSAPDGDFGHDVFGIRRHLDRSTGELTQCFVPRCSQSAEYMSEVTA